MSAAPGHSMHCVGSRPPGLLLHENCYVVQRLCRGLVERGKPQFVTVVTWMSWRVMLTSGSLRLSREGYPLCFCEAKWEPGCVVSLSCVFILLEASLHCCYHFVLFCAIAGDGWVVWGGGGWDVTLYVCCKHRILSLLPWQLHEGWGGVGSGCVYD